MASQQLVATVVAEGDHPLSPSTGQDVPDDNAQQRSEETSDMPQTVENGESIYKSTWWRHPMPHLSWKEYFYYNYLALPGIAQF